MDLLVTNVSRDRERESDLQSEFEWASDLVVERLGLETGSMAD